MVWGSLSQNYRGLYVVFYKTLTIAWYESLRSSRVSQPSCFNIGVT